MTFLGQAGPASGRAALKAGPGFVGPCLGAPMYFLLPPSASGFGVKGLGELELLENRHPGITLPVAEGRGCSVMGASQEHLVG